MEYAENKTENLIYDNEASPEEISELKNRVYEIEEGIILLDEGPVVSPFSITIVFEELRKYAEKRTNCGYLVDISKTEIPNPASRRHINEQFQSTLSNVKHVAFVTGKNFLINTAARFVMFQTNLNSFTINKTREQGISAIKKILNENS